MDYLLSDNILIALEMDPEKAEFKRLIDLMGWSQSEAARRLHKTPAAVNHLVNPAHPNKPTQTTLQLLKLIIASERPELFETAFELKEGPAGPKPNHTKLSQKERALVEMLRRAPAEEQERVYAVIKAMLTRSGGKSSKGKKPGE
jgi:hypothetical protein